MPWFVRLMVLAALLHVPARVWADDAPAVWPQWRGPTRNGFVPGNDWPDSLSAEHLKSSWRVQLDVSYSGPIVTADRVFVTETVNHQIERVTALDRSTGKELWKVEWPGSLSVPESAQANGDWIRSTPAYDGESLYVAGMRDVVVALNAASGEERWRVDFPALLKTPLPAYGCVSSPLVQGDSVYIQAGAGFCRLDKLTGRLIWRVLEDGGGLDGGAFSSPLATSINGVEQIVVQTREKLCGVDATTGRVYWSTVVPAFQGMNILSPSIVGNRAFVSSYARGTSLFGIIGPVGAKSASVVQLWTSQVAQGYLSSPILYDGHAYLYLRTQRMACIELTRGDRRWRSDEAFGQYLSLVAQGDKLMALDQTGELLLMRMSPEKYELLDRRQLYKNAWAHLAVAGREIFIRDIAGLTAYRWE